MNNLRQAAQQALEALESFQQSIGIYRGEFQQEIAALRAALAKPDRKPLTDDQIWRHLNETAMGAQSRCGYPHPSVLIELARAIEAAHGIKEQA